MRTTIVASIALIAVWAAAPAAAEVGFDGLTWYHSEDPSRLIVNDRGHLQWLKPKAPDQVTVRLPEMQLGRVGDVAEVAYLFKTEGTKTGVPSTDPTLLSGTGDLRVGLFDSSGRGHIDSDNTGYRNDIWCGYLGYLVRMCPHLPVGIKRKHSDAIPGKFMKRTGALEEDVCPSLLQKAGPYGKSKDVSGFGLEVGVFSPLILRVERVAAETLVFTVTLNDVTYSYIDDDPKLQPKKIDAMAIYFPNPIAYSSIILAGTCFSDKSGDNLLPASGETGRVLQHAIAFGGPDIFCGWPANNGVWSWGNEILVGLSYAPYIDKEGHNIGEGSKAVLARTTDGGRSWAMEDPDNFVGDGGEVRPSPGGINFAHPDFAMRVRRGSFFISYDRGRKWQGPFAFGDLMARPPLAELNNTSRTDYLVNAPDDCLIGMSIKGCGRSDRAFCARTTDGGASFRFVSWINPEADCSTRGVMPSTVRISDGKLVTTLRRKHPGEWIDAFVSDENGNTWAFLSKVADTYCCNGNPPALVRLTDGRLVCAYGNRRDFRIEARISTDQGATWSDEIVLRDDYQTDTYGDADLGYCRMVQRPDGRLVTMYYWATPAHPTHHIAATIWDPDEHRR
ncbi:MAG: sialidase family protein [Planctomycetota bacterium]